VPSRRAVGAAGAAAFSHPVPVRARRRR
jgi:hypothetical protein